MTIERNDGHLLVERRDHTLVVTLNRPQALNAMTEELMDDLRALWLAVPQERGLRSIVVTGAGKGFCSGADASILDKDLEVETAVEELAFLPGATVDVPVIAAINGVAAGGGIFFVADADIAIASTAARFLDAHVSMGQTSGIGPLLFRHRMQWSALTRMALLGRHEILDADQALASGMVSEVVEPEQLLERALQIADTVAKNSPEAVRLTRRSLRTYERALLASSTEFAWELVRRQRHHPDSAEGPRAFQEKREPQWVDR